MSLTAQTPRTTRATQSGRARWWAVGALALSVLVVGLDSYVLITALPTLSAKLGASTSQLQWITTAYTLATAGLLLPVGTLGDRIGHRRLLLGGLLLFGTSSALAGLTDSAGQLIAMRAVMGAGAAVIIPMALAILPALFPDPSDRRRGVAVITAGAMLGLPLGPILAGWMLDHVSWGWIFLINVPVVVLALLGVGLLIPASPGVPGQALDRSGAALSALGVVGVVYCIIQQPIDGWSPVVLAALVGGLMALAVFVLRQFRVASPLVDLRLLGNPTFGWGTFAFAVTSFAMTGVLFVLTPFLQVVEGNDAQGTGLRLLPMIGAMLVAAVVSERLARRIAVKWLIPAGMLLSVVGLVALAALRVHGGYGPVALGLVVFGAGLGITLPLAADAVLDTLPADKAGMGNALSRTVQSVGVALGAAILGSLLNSAYRSRLAPTLDTLQTASRGAARSSVPGAHEVAAHLPFGARTSLLDAADHAYLHGLAQSLLTCSGLLAVSAFLVLLLLPRRR